ncbi:MAG: hypothetical protein GWO20_02895, partial [Candidatus Korarchaeota archaeon]|nr:hypothetical protein [Candidatus Korarchaeota archaeon]NIU82420.1 hypothetical protein [Candidatus Thorarchaeota archaeon]
ISELGEVNTDIKIKDDMVSYIDTDSVFIMLGHFLDQVLTNEDWKEIDEEKIIEIILEVSAIVEKYVNDC